MYEKSDSEHKTAEYFILKGKELKYKAAFWLVKILDYMTYLYLLHVLRLYKSPC
jgi:hypothetical protein